MKAAVRTAEAVGRSGAGTLKDKLSRLDLVRAGRLLGSDGEALIREGGKREIDFDSVELTENRMTLRLPDATVQLFLDVAARNRINWRCSSCRSACEHVGAALSLVLEEKTALGLAAPPLMKTPLELLSDEQVVERLLTERRQRALSEPMVLGLTPEAGPWSDHTVTTLNSGRTYRVALRGWERGQSYCSCPDFRKNTLGTCKHILFALDHRTDDRGEPAADALGQEATVHGGA
ncbi:MAG: SWIM zinc finger family protein [Acidobacteriota bacterium]